MKTSKHSEQLFQTIRATYWKDSSYDNPDACLADIIKDLRSFATSAGMDFERAYRWTLTMEVREFKEELRKLDAMLNSVPPPP